jgi:tryptophan-rich sensory protein
MRTKDIAALGAISVLTAAASLLGSTTVRRTPRKLWYRSLRKPAQTPPDWAFGVVWPALYGLTAYSGYRVWQRREEPGAKTGLALWGTQLAFNAAWTPLFFGRHRARAALVDLGLNFASLLAYAVRVAPVDRTAAVLMAPYLGWLAFAGTLNAGIIRRNPRWLAG